MAAAGGDQLIAALGVWKYGWIPGIKTIDHIADDVYQSNLNILMSHYYAGEKGCDMQGVILNSKGFGGNNASALVLSPHQTRTMLTKKYGAAAMKAYDEKNAKIQAQVDAIDLKTCQGQERIIYKFGESVMDQSSVSMTQTQISLSAFAEPIDLPTVNPYVGY